MLSRRTSDALLLLVGTCVLWAQPAAAQPTAEQQSALRSNCRSDFMSNCSGVQPGGMEALQCLKRNVAKLSPGCQSAVNALNRPQAQPAAAPAPAVAPHPAQPAAVEHAPAPAAAPPAAAPAIRAATPQPAPAAAPRQPGGSQQTAIRQACQRDFRAHCAGVQPGGAAAVQCLQQHAGQLSLNCARAVVALGGAPGGARPGSVAPTLASTPPPAAAAPSSEQLSAVKMSCRRDFMFNCRGVQPGGPEALACLQRNAARLSPDCRISLAAIADAAPATDAPPVAAEPAPPPRLRPVGPLRRAIRERMMEQQ